MTTVKSMQELEKIPLKFREPDKAGKGKRNHDLVPEKSFSNCARMLGISDYDLGLALGYKRSPTNRGKVSRRAVIAAELYVDKKMRSAKGRVLVLRVPAAERDDLVAVAARFGAEVIGDIEA